MADTAAPEVSPVLKESNEDRKRDKHRRSIIRAHEYRCQIWAKMTLKIQADQAALDVLGGETVDLFKPDFDDPAMIAHYASMTLSK